MHGIASTYSSDSGMRLAGGRAEGGTGAPKEETCAVLLAGTTASVHVLLRAWEIEIHPSVATCVTILAAKRPIFFFEADFPV